MDLLLDDFEGQCRAGTFPLIETILSDVDAADRGRLFEELLVIEVFYRRHLEQRIEREVYQNRFPEFQAEIDRAFGEASTNRLLDTPGPTAPLTPRVPELEGYQFLGKVGEGGMGIVYRARQLRLQREVAVKTLGRYSLFSAEELARLGREAAAMAKLSHPNIVQVYDVISQADQTFIVLELVNGTSLQQAIRSKVFDDQQAAEIVLLVARAIAAVHKAGLLHRDIKPANILIDEFGVPKVTDFGLAKSHEENPEHTKTSAIMGSPSYMAPEQTLGESNRLNQTTDVYGIGATLYELLCQRPPFVGTSPMATMKLVQEEEPVAPSRLRNALSKDLETICLKCLEKQPKNRYASATQLADDLERFLAGKPVVARPITRIARIARWSKRHPERALLSIGSLLIAIATLGLVLWISKENLQRELQQEKNRITSLFASLSKIRENTLARPPGWKLQNEKLIREASGLMPSSTDLFSLRSQYLQTALGVELQAEEVVPIKYEAYGLAWSPDGTRVAIGRNNAIGGSVTVEIYSGPQLKLEKTVSFLIGFGALTSAKTNGVRSLLFSADGQRLYCGSRSGRLHVWNTSDWSEQPSLKVHEDHVMGICELPNNLLATASEDMTVAIWKLDTGEQVTRIPFPKKVTGIASSNGRLLVHADDLYSIPLQQALTISKTPKPWKKNVFSFAITPDGAAVALSMADGIEIHELHSNSRIRRFRSAEQFYSDFASVSSMTFSLDGDWLISANGDNILLWDWGSGNAVAYCTLARQQNLSVSFRAGHPQEAFAVSNSGLDKLSIRPRNGVQRVMQQSYPYRSAGMSRNGSTIAANWSRLTPVAGKGPGESSLAISPSPFDQQRNIPFGTEVGFGVDVNHDGSQIAIPTSQHGIVKIDASSGELTQIPSQLSVSKINWCPNDQFLLISGRDETKNLLGLRNPNELQLIDSRDSSLAATWSNVVDQLEKSTSSFSFPAFGADKVCVSSAEHRLRVFTMSNLEIYRDISIPDHQIGALAMLPGNQTVAVGTHSGDLLVVDLERQQIVHSLEVSATRIATIACYGEYLFCGTDLGELACYVVVDGNPTDYFHVKLNSGELFRIIMSEDSSRLMIHQANDAGVWMIDFKSILSEFASLGIARRE